MAGKNPKQVRQLSDEKAAEIAARLDAFEGLILQSADILTQALFQQFLEKLDVKSGIVSSTDDNLRRVSLIDRAFQAFNEKQGIRILATFATDLVDIVNLGKEFYLESIGQQASDNQITDIIYNMLGLRKSGDKWLPKTGGYLANIVDDTQLQNELKRRIFEQVSTNAIGYNNLRDMIEEYVKGTGEEDPGQYYRYYEQVAFDTYAQVDRLNGKLHADRLKLRYFLYNGGVIRDSRQFCRDHHGKCWSTEEASTWKSLIGQFKLVPGKRKPLIKVPIGPIVAKGDEDTYDPLTMLGGIKCRHSADWVSDLIAQELRKNQKPPGPVDFSTPAGARANVDIMKATNRDTFKHYLDDEGRFIQARHDLQVSIASGPFKGKQPASGQKIVQMLGGAAGNGKSTLLNSGQLTLPPGAIMVNPDDIKESLPEYKIMLQQKDKAAAAFVHEESSWISKQVRSRGIDEGYNMVIDAVADGGIDKLRENVKDLKRNGHYVKIDYVTLDTDLSLKLVEDRYKKTGRYVPEQAVLDMNREIAKIVPAAIQERMFDELNLWDTNINGKPRLILTQKGGNVTIFDQELYNNFLKKARYGEK